MAPIVGRQIEPPILSDFRSIHTGSNRRGILNISSFQVFIFRVSVD